MRYNPWRGVTTLPSEVWVLFTANLVNRMGSMARAFLVLYITTRLGVSPAHAGVALTVFGVAAILAGPMAGRVTDRIGALPVMWGALAGSALLVAMIPLLGSFAGVLTCVALWAFVSEGFRPASLVMLSEANAPEYRRLAMSVNRLAINLGTSIGPAIGGILAGISFTALFCVDALTSLIGAIVLFSWWYRHGRTSPRSVHVTRPRTFGTILRDPRLLQLTVGTLLTVAVFMQIEGAWSFYLIKTLHYAPAFYGAMLTVNGLLIVTCEIPIVHATGHWSHRRVITAACVLLALGFGAMAFVRTPGAVIATVVLWTVGEMLLFTMLPIFYEERATPELRGMYLGAYSATISAAGAVGSWLGMAVLAGAGPTVLWGSTFIVSLLAAVVLTSPVPARQH